MLRVFSIMIMLLSSVLLTACYDDVVTGMHAPGVYKGPIDPLLSASKSSAHKERLRERFDMVQTDR
ncbi:MAG: hypothetical protein OEY29_06930 [Gammaproteobacteria bacterium]|nr:hypothetical protein [Gammaproteobacteria bacterium]